MAKNEQNQLAKSIKEFKGKVILSNPNISRLTLSNQAVFLHNQKSQNKNLDILRRK